MRMWWVSFFLLFTPAQAQHAPEHVELHQKFYSTWLVPNGGKPRASGCCNAKDCAPASIRYRDGHWEGRREQDKGWYVIPDATIEANQSDPRESPDGRSHICVNGLPGTVICAVMGTGN